MRNLLVMSFVMLGAVAGCAEETHTKEAIADVKKAVDSGKAVLLDVREPSEWNDGHLKQATPLPLKAFRAEPKAPASLRKDMPIYVHCRSGARALEAAGLLKKQGYDARALKPGFDELGKAGFEKSETTK